MMATILPFERPEPARSMPECRTPAACTHARHDDLWGEWMVRAQNGDREAYHALLSDIAPYVRAVTHRYLGRGEDAEDAVQDILLVVHDIRHTYESGRPFKPWLSTIASRRCIDILRRRTRRFQHEVADDAILDRFHEASPGPDEAAARLHAARTVHAAVAALPPKQREAIRLVHLDELSLSEASARSHTSVGALKVAGHRALKLLRQTLIAKGARS